MGLGLLMLVLIFSGISFVGLSEFHPWKTELLDCRTKWSAAVFVLIGFWTFFVPNISFDPPVLGRAFWSPLEIALRLDEGALPGGADGGDAVIIMIYFATVYLSLILALLSLAMHPSRKLFGGCTAFGLFATIAAMRGNLLRQSLEGVFYGRFYYPMQGGADHDQHTLLLLVVMTALNAIVYYASSKV